MTKEKAKILVGGCNGRMGQILCRLIDKSETFKVQYAYDKTAWEWPNYCVVTNLDDIDEDDLPDIIIDFSSPQGTIELLEFAKYFSIPIVIATTGLTENDNTLIHEASKLIPVFQSANMSLGINLMKRTVSNLAPLLEGADIEIVETHHNKKKDVPSGTALLLANSINDSLGNTRKIVYGRTGKRESGEIGISAIRGGNIPGTHTVYFFLENETIEFTHTDHSPDVFAEGALKAAEFLLGKDERGLYGMDDMLM